MPAALFRKGEDHASSAQHWSVLHTDWGDAGSFPADVRGALSLSPSALATRRRIAVEGEELPTSRGLFLARCAFAVGRGDLC